MVIGGIAAGIVVLGGIGFSIHNLTKAPPAKPTTETPAVEKSTILVTVSPATAKIFVDDIPVPGNPGQMVIARDGNTHRVRAEAPGYETKNQAVFATLAAISVDFSLERADAPQQPTSQPPPAAPPPPGPGPIRVGQAPRNPPPVNTGTKPPTGQAPPPPPPATTGSTSPIYTDPWK
jgi:hypothetical protein